MQQQLLLLMLLLLVTALQLIMSLPTKESLEVWVQAMQTRQHLQRLLLNVNGPSRRQRAGDCDVADLWEKLRRRRGCGWRMVMGGEGRPMDCEKEGNEVYEAYEMLWRGEGVGGVVPGAVCRRCGHM